jgi:PPK2 family polyphosphate:nucleotide phosphotransferase
MAKKEKDHFLIQSSKPLKLSKIPTKATNQYRSDAEYESLLKAFHEQIAEYQTLFYASHSKGLLIIFQGMDTSGKDGAISHVMSGVNPQGCSVVSFKSPSKIELDHDFLWRTNLVLPVRGQIGIFNRSYYEEILITRVHPELLEQEHLPTKKYHNKNFWNHRYNDIVNYEKYLHHQGFEIVKIFLHISKDEQKRRLLSRFENPKKLWKIDESDIRERQYWKQYQTAYEECLRNTSTEKNPWHIIPGDDKKGARLAISRILIEQFQRMHLQYPKVTSQQKLKLKKLKALLSR